MPEPRMEGPEVWIDIWRDVAAMTTGIPYDGPAGRKICALLDSGDLATQRRDLGMLRYVQKKLRGVVPA